MEIGEISERFYNIKNQAYHLKDSFDTPCKWFDKDFAAFTVNDFYEEKKSNPTAAEIALSKEWKKQPLKYESDTKYNIKVFENSPETDVLIRKIKQYDEKNYPKTRSLRNKLINEGRFELENVTPKLTGLKKFMLKLRLFGSII